MIRINFGACLVAIFAGSLLSGCVSFQPNTSKHAVVDRNGLDIVIEDGSKKATIFKDVGSTERYCRTPNPDFAAVKGGSFAIPTGIGTSVGASDSSAVDSLGGRSPAVLITRELMYRACELSLNVNADPDLTRAIYTQFLAIITVALTDQTEDGVASSEVATSAEKSVAGGSNPGAGSPGAGSPSALKPNVLPPGLPKVLPPGLPNVLPPGLQR